MLKIHQIFKSFLECVTLNCLYLFLGVMKSTAFFMSTISKFYWLLEKCKIQCQQKSAECVGCQKETKVDIIIYIFFVLSIYCLTAEYLEPNIGTAVGLLYIISQVYADAIYIVTIIIAVVTYHDWL